MKAFHLILVAGLGFFLVAGSPVARAGLDRETAEKMARDCDSAVEKFRGEAARMEKASAEKKLTPEQAHACAEVQKSLRARADAQERMAAALRKRDMKGFDTAQKEDREALEQIKAARAKLTAGPGAQDGHRGKDGDERKTGKDERREWNESRKESAPRGSDRVTSIQSEEDLQRWFGEDKADAAKR